jgi:ubiquinone/menaquinone biosynthesis C-methylase UbiE
MDVHEKIKLWEREEGAALYRGFGFNESSKVLDYGCGFGHYTLAASRALDGQGTIYAVDIDKGILKHVSAVALDEGLRNIVTAVVNKDFSLNFENEFLDMILYYDIFHGEGLHRLTLLEEAKRTLKKGGILSVLPFHLSNFRDKEGKKKKYTYKKLIEEIKEYGFEKVVAQPRIGIHFEKYHSPHYINKGGVEFEELERAEIINFIKCRTK